VIDLALENGTPASLDAAINGFKTSTTDFYNTRKNVEIHSR
jgi:hypothetical protein